MADANRTQLTRVTEVTIGTTPNTPRMRTVRFAGEDFAYEPGFEDSEEIRADRMNADPIKVSEQVGGSLNFELSYPVDASPMSEDIASAMQSPWSNTAQRDNDGTADSVITAVATTNTEVTHLTGTAFVASQLVRFTGFGVAGNNGVFKCTTGGATTSRYVGSGITDETAPAAAARMKVVGFQGASGDITATASGLGATTLDFTTLGLSVGQWIKIGGSAAGDKFATAALNGWARITAIAASALTLDNRPTGWTTDAGSGKTIKVWIGDTIKNGTTRLAGTFERGFLDQTVPTYIVQKGMEVDQFSLQIQSKRKVTGSIAYMGLSGAESTTTLDASPDAAPSIASYPILAAGANVARLAEGGSALGAPNYVRSLSFSIRNNLRGIEDVGSVSDVDHGVGSCDVEVNAETYFGSDALLAKLFGNTATSMAAILTKNSQAMIWTFPRLTPRAGRPNAPAKNRDVLLPLRLTASLDSTTNAHVMAQRVEYYE